MLYRCRGRVVLWLGAQGAWHFVHVDKKISEKIRAGQKGPHRGFGAVKVKVTIGKTTWTTSIFPDSRSGTYLLPLKAAVRRAEGVSDGDMITFRIVT